MHGQMNVKKYNIAFPLLQQWLHERASILRYRTLQSCLERSKAHIVCGQSSQMSFKAGLHHYFTRLIFTRYYK